MKFKNDNQFEEDCRTLSLTDKGGDTISVHLFKSKYNVVFSINDGECVGTSKPKALKLAMAILEELSPSAI